jgi:hypothetical protein
VRKRRVESFEKRRKKDVKRGKINRKVCVWKRKKEKKGKERKKYMHEKEKNKKRECNTRKFHHNKILLATWFSFIF